MNITIRHICIFSVLACSVFIRASVQAEGQTLNLYDQVMERLADLKPDQTINVIMAAGKEVYDLGDLFDLRFRTDKPGYITLMHISAAGEITFLVPSIVATDNKIQALQVYSSVHDFNLPLTISPPEGTEIVNLFCSTEPLELFKVDFTKDPMYTVTRDDEQRLQELLFRLEQLQHVSWSGTSVQFRVGSASPLPNAGSRSAGQSQKFGAIVPPIATTGTTGKDILFPPIGTTGTAGYSE